MSRSCRSQSGTRGRGPAPPSHVGLALLICLGALPVSAEVRLSVGGGVEDAGDGLLVRLDLTNGGDSAASRVDVEGELFGHYAEGTLPAGVAAGARQSLWLHFPPAPDRPGVHALALHLRYPVVGLTDAASQRAYLLLAIGAAADPAVRLTAHPAAFETTGALGVALESADGAAHDVQVRVLTARGINALAQPQVHVPAAGTVTAEVPLIRVGPLRHEAQGVVVLATATTDGLASTAAGTTMVDLVYEPPLMPRLRIPLIIAGALLLMAAVAGEIVHRLRNRTRNSNHDAAA